MSRALRLAVIGDPIAHSKSPELQQRFLSEAGLRGTYEGIRVSAGDGARAIDDLRARGYDGLNVTTPLKEEAFARADWCDTVAIKAQSVNAMLLGADRIEGYNNDGIGAVGALRAAGIARLSGAAVLVLGTGPTARATLVTLCRAGAEALVWSRTVERAADIAVDLGIRVWTEGEPVAAALSALPPNPDLPGTLRDVLLRVPIVIDANYGPRATLAATLQREDVQDGLAMLEASARASFELFRALV